MLALAFGTRNLQEALVELVTPLHSGLVQLTNVKPSSGVACWTTSVLKSRVEPQSVWPGPPPQSIGSTSGLTLVTLPFGLLATATLNCRRAMLATTLSVLP